MPLCMLRTGLSLTALSVRETHALVLQPPTILLRLVAETKFQVQKLHSWTLIRFQQAPMSFLTQLQQRRYNDLGELCDHLILKLMLLERAYLYYLILISTCSSYEGLILFHRPSTWKFIFDMAGGEIRSQNFCLL